MYSHSSRFLSRRGFCSCCAVAASLAVNRRWLRPAEAYAAARDIVDTIRDAAAPAPLQLHKLRGNVTIIEGSGGNIGVLTGADGKVEHGLFLGMATLALVASENGVRELRP